MPPRLVIVAGPSLGAQVALETEEVVLGRDSGCEVCLPDATLSRRHAVLVRAPEGWRLKDLGSLNGLRVNGLSTADHLLGPGDRIELGSSVLVYRPEGWEAAGAAAPGLPAPAALSTIRLPLSEALFAGDEAAPASRKTERSLGLLLAAGRRFATERTEEGLARALLLAACDAIGGSTGVVLLAGEGAGLREAAASRNGPRSDQIPSGAAVEALERREAVALRLDRHHAAAVPILRGEDRLGVLWLVAGDVPVPEDDLQLLFGLCASAGASLALVKHLVWLEGERRRLEAPADDEELRGDSAAIGRVRALLARAAASEASVLLAGESGTGKELAARALHARSQRRDGPFVAVNAAALVDTLVESELFGHERGAFTGAVARRRGRLESAHHGTLFLDEVGEMAPSTQAKLLRVLETRSFERVGGTESVRVDVRIVAATNRDLPTEVREKRFREDLYYRLAVVTITLPPLRERREDIPGLASFFLARHAQRLGRRLDGFLPAALGRLVSYEWPGNVRELSNAVERAAVLSAGPLVRLEDLPETLVEGPGGRGEEALPPYHEAVNRAKQQVVAAALAESRGNVTEAARLLGLHPNYLHRLLNQLGLREVPGT
ncbi:MAG: sigma 54-dependent Fis family transcriptional regulator [Holophagales bacterium]|nr:sigma 54-dependent Fis family transcriptional regulator [Holophagales bacterium]